MCSAAATTDDDAEAAPIPAIDIADILNADFFTSWLESLEGSSSSSGSSA